MVVSKIAIATVLADINLTVQYGIMYMYVKMKVHNIVNIDVFLIW